MFAGADHETLFASLGDGFLFDSDHDYPIHIVVKGGHVVLLGVVDNDSDKNVAAIRAREAAGAFTVDNQLMVENPKKSTSR